MNNTLKAAQSTNSPLIALTVWSAVVLLLFFTGQFMIASLASHWLVDKDIVSDKDQAQVLLMTLSIIGGGVLGLIATVIIVAKSKLTVTADLGLQKPNRYQLLAFVIAAVAFNVAIIALSRLTGWQSGQVMADFMEIGATSVLTWLAVIIIAPIFEELVFRGYMYAKLKPTHAGTLGALFLPNLVWMLIHIGQYAPFGLILIFAAGLLFSWARWKTDSLITPLVMHMAFNATTLLVHLF